MPHFLNKQIVNCILDDQSVDLLLKTYNDKNRWSYTFQNFAFLTRAKILLDAIQENKYNYFESQKF